jgi:hypothetical protein
MGLTTVAYPYAANESICGSTGNMLINAESAGLW